MSAAPRKPIRTGVDVAAPPAVVFAHASDFARAPEVVDAIVKVEMLTEGPLAVGTRFKETRRMFGKEASEVLEVVELEPPRRYVLGAENHGCRYRTEIACEPAPGGTRLSMTFAVEPLTRFARIMTFLMRPMLKSMAKQCAKDLDCIKRAAEADAAR
ncbi:MAG: SRPBCC family protein [Planctomycetes bacterium]|nr:SRPBCC family protein [Planctomycetota bacterium]